MTKKRIESVKQSLLADKDREVIPSSDLLGTGSTLLNLALSDRTIGGYPKGKYILLVGDSESAKSWLALSAFAEATLRDEFDGYRFIYDNPEDGASMDKVRFFGDGVMGRLESERLECSVTVEQFYDNLDIALDLGKPFIYVLDSETSLDCEADLKKRAKAKKARLEDREEAGSFGDGKARYHSTNLRTRRNRLAETGSILILIAQTRQRIGFGAQFDPKTRAGGDALRFYAHQEIWTSVKKSLTTKVKEKTVQQGILVTAKVKKNRLTGKKWSVDIPIYWSHGIDDTGACVDYLVEYGRWKKSGNGRIDTGGDLGRTYPTPIAIPHTREGIIRHIESEGLEKKLHAAVQKVWYEVEAASSVVRKPRYN